MQEMDIVTMETVYCVHVSQSWDKKWTPLGSRGAAAAVH